MKPFWYAKSRGVQLLLKVTVNSICVDNYSNQSLETLLLFYSKVILVVIVRLLSKFYKMIIKTNSVFKTTCLYTDTYTWYLPGINGYLKPDIFMYFFS